ncbi:hypothetical protein VTK73DRAFT_6316 [Phialemonium thermophilum]|uniref:Uncharacterized protein n=1 Tax=Phialemonium thermophilum TaxID=223376 RepID=A0ABR3UZN2_9PEZI
MQDKIVPLVKAIKTKEPAVMMAALHVLRVVGRVADAEFVATDILPLLWSMSLGPLLNLEQFKAFMRLIRSLSARVEEEQTKKLQELSGSSGGVGANAGAMSGDDILSLGGLTLSSPSLDANGTTPDDFERLVKGKSDGGGSASSPASAVGGGWDSGGRAASTTVTSPTVTQPPAFSWSTPSPSIAAAKAGQQPASFRTVTPDLGHRRWVELVVWVAAVVVLRRR